MPARQPFTQLCQQLGRPRQQGRVDLHLHTTASDGTYTPEQLVEVARRSGLAAIAVTDHDTVAGVLPARAAAGEALEVCAGVEITAEFRGQELHLLGYCFDLGNPPLRRALDRLCEARAARFREMVERLGKLGVQLSAAEVTLTGKAMGRRHLAELLVKAGRVATVREAFQRYLGDRGRAAVPKVRLQVAEAIHLVRGAGGIAAWAHPAYDCTEQVLVELRALGLQALEVDFPGGRGNRGKTLRRLAEKLGLAMSGGSDCHGADQPRQAVGACGVSYAEFCWLKQLATF